MRTAVLLPLCAMAALGQAQRIERFELRPAADLPRLYVRIDGTDRLISNRALKAWPGWTPQTLIYSERAAAGGTTNRLRWYDAFTRNSYTIATDELTYEGVETARLSNGTYAILIALRDPESHVPYVELATPQGVFLREQFATFGTAANDAVQVRRFAPEDVKRHKGDFNLLSPIVIASVSLLPKAPEAAGVYEATLAGGDGVERRITLNLRAGGQATLVSTTEGKAPAGMQGKWTQTGAEVRVELESGPFVWVVGANGLTPKLWNRREWGSIGVPLRRSGGQ